MSFNPSPQQDRLTKPRIYLLRMAVFVILAGFIAFILYQPIWTAFLANPGLNGLILGVLAVGIVLSFRQVTRLFREINWVNGWHSEITVPRRQGHAPVLLQPLAILLNRSAPATGVTALALRAALDSISLRLDEARDIGRYLTGLLVFLGLLGTFWGLLETVGSVGQVIQAMKGGSDAALMFDELKSGLAAPLSGMGISFSSSLFGLAGSLVLGFLDLQAGQAQNRFYQELEDWLSAAVLDLSSDPEIAGDRLALIETSLQSLRATMAPGDAVASLAMNLQTMVEHMRGEQQMLRDWVEAQALRDEETKKMILQALEGRKP